MKKIIVDTNEFKNDLELVKHLEANKKFEIIGENLQLGDYRIGKFVIERKTRADWIASSRDGRLKKFCDNAETIRDAGGTPVILLEGNTWYPAKKDRNMSWYELDDTFNIVQFTYGIQIVMQDDQKRSAHWIISLDRYDGSDLGVVRKPAKKDVSIRDQQVYHLMGFYGIGKKTAEGYIDEYKGDLFKFFADVHAKKKKGKIFDRIRGVLVGKNHTRINKRNKSNKHK